MRLPSVPMAEQFRLVTECRQSGLSDYQWCKDHGISPNTFYNWVSRLRRKGYALPDRAEKEGIRQEVVKLNIVTESEVLPEPLNFNGSFPVPEKELVCDAGFQEVKDLHPVMELIFGQAVLRISAETDASFLASLMNALKERSC